MSTRIFTATVVLIGAALAAAWWVRRRDADGLVPSSGREEQQTQSGTPIVEEWGEESFPASDPPQSW